MWSVNKLAFFNFFGNKEITFWNYGYIPVSAGDILKMESTLWANVILFVLID